MRTGGQFEVEAMTPQEHHHLATAAATSTGWKSPVPYLFGGLAAMLGLIAFALLILACSYWKLSGYLDAGAGEDSGDGKAADGGEGEKGRAVFANTVLVIMAGEEKPTFLATPAATTKVVAGFGDAREGGGSSGSGEEGEEGGRREKVVVEMGSSVGGGAAS